MQPYFSVIVPLYQCEPYIEKCIGSLIDQTFGDFEVICIDDGSTDNGFEVAKRQATRDSRFSFLQLPENRGQSAARNCALDVAQGKVVVLLDADDYLEEHALEHIAERFRQQNLDDLYFNAESFYESSEAYSRVQEDFSNRKSFDDVATGQELFTFFEGRGQFYPHGALRAVRRDLIERHSIRFKEGMIHEDLLFSFQTLVLSKRSSFLNEPIYRRRIHSGSTMATPRRTMRNIEGHLESIHFMQGWMDEHADELNVEFIEAMAHRLEEYLNLCAMDYLNDVTEAEKAAYLTELSVKDRIRFEMEVSQRAELLREFYNARTWKIGLTVTAIPRALRDGLAKLRKIQP